MVEVEWSHVLAAIRALRDRSRRVAVTGIYPARPEASFPASLVAVALDVPLLDVPAARCLILDTVASGSRGVLDLVDTYPSATYDALYRSTGTPVTLAPSAPETNQRLRMPWEQQEQQSGADSLHSALASVFARLGHPNPDGHQAAALFAAYLPPEQNPAQHLTDVERVNPEQRSPVTNAAIPFTSLSAGLLLPFHGTATVSYVPNPQVGAARAHSMTKTVQGFANQLQTQQHLTKQILDAVVSTLGTDQAAIVTTCHHSNPETLNAKNVTHHALVVGDNDIADIAHHHHRQP